MIFYHDIEQGTPEWFKRRLGILTASQMKNIITPKTLKLSAASETHMYELLAQRIRRFVDVDFIGNDMLRGMEDEPVARALYAEKEGVEVKPCGFITNSRYGFTLGYSPDGLVGEDGLTEIKSRVAKYQVESILAGKPDVDHVIQLQAGLLVSEREWVDYISYCRTPKPEEDDGRRGLPMAVYRVYPDTEMQEAILLAATQFHEKLDAAMDKYQEALSSEVVRLYDAPLVEVINNEEWSV